MRGGRAKWLVIVLYFLGASTAISLADQNRGRARQFYDSAISHYNLSEYRAALDDFKEAYRALHDPVLLFNIAQCHRKLNDSENAAVFYHAFLREVPDAPNSQEVARLIAEMERQAHVAPSPPAQVVPALLPPVVLVQAAARDRSTVPPTVPLARRRWIWAAVAGGVALVGAGVTLGVVFGVSPVSPVASAGKVRGN